MTGSLIRPLATLSGDGSPFPENQREAANVTTATPETEERIYKKVTWRLLPFLGACYLIAYLDRVNVGFAKLHMLSDLNLSETAYGFGAGVFFIGYFLFEVPSNLILHRVGARTWIARIMVTWGIISGAMAFTEPFARMTGLGTDTVFYSLRFLLGAAEAGFYPGVLLYLNYWYPSHRQSRAVALLLTAQPLSYVLGGPISGGIMASFNGVGGLYDWQWLYLIEAAPALVFSVLVIVYLKNRIDDAHWLEADEKQLLKNRLERDAKTKRDYPLRALFAVKELWLFTGIFLLIVMGVYGINFWLPTLIKNSGVQSVFAIGLITAASYLIGAVIALLATRHAERHNEKRWHAAAAAMVGGASLALSAVFADNTFVTVAFITLASAGRAGFLRAVLELSGLRPDGRGRRGGPRDHQLDRQSRRLLRPLSAGRTDRSAGQPIRRHYNPRRPDDRRRRPDRGDLQELRDRGGHRYRPLRLESRYQFVNEPSGRWFISMPAR